MCYDDSSDKIEGRPMNPPESSKPARRRRTKTRRPKYVSLWKKELSPECSSESSQMTTATEPATHQQLTLFPLHPEKLFNDKPEANEHAEEVACFIVDEEAACGGSTPTLDGILGMDEEEGNNSYGGQRPQGGRREEGAAWSLEQAALRQRERDVSEEKWVVYSEVVERKRSTAAAEAEGWPCRTQGLLLKLDYEEIMNAWSDKGPLYIADGGLESPQTVPDLAHDSANDYMDVGYALGNAKQLWSVPEDGSSVTEDGREVKKGERQAKVLRYKEKRQSRLFSKRIRYEVRKINAEKRPRMKGRFVKWKTED